MNYRLSLAGVAGLIVAIGLTADSFIVYFERIRDELRDGRALASAVETGWKRAKRTILASKAVNILAAVVLYIVAVGNVSGFAFTLGLTTVVDVIVVFLFTHPMLQLLAKTKFFGEGHQLLRPGPARCWVRCRVPRRGRVRSFSTEAAGGPRQEERAARQPRPSAADHRRAPQAATQRSRPAGTKHGRSARRRIAANGQSRNFGNELYTGKRSYQFVGQAQALVR